MKDRSLVVFTVLAQAAAGTALAVACCRAVLHLGGLAIPRLEGGLGWSTFVTAPLAACAVAVSLLHLGNPLRAPLALLNLRTSWLSREILGAALFLLGAGASAAARAWSDLGATSLFALDTASALSGAALVIVMAKAYRLRTVLTWNTWRTLAAFTLTALVLGTLIVGTLVCAAVYRDPELALLRLGSLLTSALAVPLLALSALLHINRGLVLRLLAALACGAAAVLPSAAPDLGLHTTLTLGLALCLATTAELMSRAGFYESRREVLSQG